MYSNVNSSVNLAGSINNTGNTGNTDPSLVPALPGVLFVWTDVEPEHETDFNRWYDREHVAERVNIAGFVSGTRYVGQDGARRYLGLYRTTSLAAFKTPAYFQAFSHQTPWSVANLGRMVDPMRRVCEIDAETGAGTGAWLTVLRLGASAAAATAPNTLKQRIAEIGQGLLEIDGVLSSRLLTPDTALSTPLPAENTSARVLDPMLLIDASSEAAAAAAGRQAALALGINPDDIALLQLSWQLREQDLPAKFNLEDIHAS